MAQTALAAYKAGQRSVRRSRSHGRTKTTIPLAVIGGFAPLAKDLYDGYTNGGFTGISTVLQRDLLAYDPETSQFNPYWALRRAYGPIILGALVHKLIGGRLGVNRMLARTGIPLIRL